MNWNKNCVLEEESQGYSKSGIQSQTAMKEMDFRGGEHTILRTETTALVGLDQCECTKCIDCTENKFISK